MKAGTQEARKPCSHSGRQADNNAESQVDMQAGSMQEARRAYRHPGRQASRQAGSQLDRHIGMPTIAR